MQHLDIIKNKLQNKETYLSIIKKPIMIFTFVVFITVFLHYILVQSYVTFCASWGLMGFFKTFITLGSPTCHFINLAQFELAKHYIAIWIGAGASIITWIVSSLNKKINK
jgi:hypothetical protein